MRVPILYKYLKPERIDVLESGKVMLTRPRAFNDPFETLPHFETTEEFLYPIPKGADQDVLAWIKQKQEWLNQTLMTPSKRKTYLEARTSSIVILSLAENRDSLLMWSHYAASHKGFLIGFDSRQDILAIDSQHRHKGKVLYTDERPSKPTFEELSNDELLLTKSKEWEYEQEWRIIDSLFSADGEAARDEPNCWPFLFRPEAVCEVIIGCRFGDSHERVNAVLQEARCSHVEFLQAKLDERRFGLVFSKVY